MSDHELTGIAATCICGWTSGPCSSASETYAAFMRHAQDAAAPQADAGTKDKGWRCTDSRPCSYEAVIAGKLYRAQGTYRDTVSVWFAGTQIATAYNLTDAWLIAVAHAHGVL
jgi:hypothetical protein